MGSERQEGVLLIPGLPDEVAMDCLARVPYRFHCGLRSVCRGWRDLLGSPLFYSQRRKTGKGEALVCLVQALRAGPRRRGRKKNAARAPPCYGLSIYNSTLGEWHRLSFPPASGLAVPLFAQCAAVQASGKIVLMGGWDPTSFDSVSDVYVIDLVTGRGRRGAPMTPARSFFACAVVGPLVYVAGGHDNQKNALRTAAVYDTAADEWRPLPPMADERDECQGVALAGEFWVVSGYGTDSQGRFDPAVECYDPAAGRWRKEEGLWTAGDGLGGAVVPPRSSCFVLEKLCHLYCNEDRREMREYEETERKWKVVGETPATLRSIPCVRRSPAAADC
ncbi:unnamed protein product [Spirodela intermedia]|uniref:F-box domain-containing protein n=1 Tax=Spirodela intermedia TaxID=51605 RepID=A0A7I8ISY7_SPIIN|nr:unnamed protein product [Spirodela intermedia]CAA6660255.1 unnamed protein product [Spirodela intermedia]